MPGKHLTIYAIYCAFVVFYLGDDTRALSGKPAEMARRSAVRDTRQASKPESSPIKAGLSLPLASSRDTWRGATSDTKSHGNIASAGKREELVLSLIHYPWKNLGYEVVFLGPRRGYRAMTLADRRRIEIYVRPGENPRALAYDLAHELGHAFDLEFNSYERRGQWRKLRGISPDSPWFGCDGCSDYATPAGDFAETFALLLLGPGDYHSLVAPQPTPKQVAELADFCHLDSREYSEVWQRQSGDAIHEQARIALPKTRK